MDSESSRTRGSVWGLAAQDVGSFALKRQVCWGSQMSPVGAGIGNRELGRDGVQIQTGVPFGGSCGWEAGALAWPTHLSSRLANKGSQCKLNLPRGVEKLAGRGRRPSHDLVNHRVHLWNPIPTAYFQEFQSRLRSCSNNFCATWAISPSQNLYCVKWKGLTFYLKKLLLGCKY